MKKSLFTLLVVMLFGTAAIAQTPTTHHFAQNVYEDLNGTMFGELFIDGELQTGYNWEIGVFDENTWEYTGSGLPLYLPDVSEGPCYNFTYSGYVGDILTFKLYNHDTGEEVDYVCSLTLTFETDMSLGNSDELYPINFYSEGQDFVFNGDGSWGNLEFWTVNGQAATRLPNSLDNVTIESGICHMTDNTQFGALTIEDDAQLYAPENADIYATVKKNIEAYEGLGGWYLLGFPTDLDTPDFVGAGMITNSNYDLFFFDQTFPGEVDDETSNNGEWRNYKYYMQNGLEFIAQYNGYLYANAQNTTLHFTGNLYTEVSVEYKRITYYNENPEQLGVNLIGNPYTCNAEMVAGARIAGYYMMNEERNDVVVYDDGDFDYTYLAPMAAFFAVASANNNNAKITLSPLNVEDHDGEEPGIIRSKGSTSNGSTMSIELTANGIMKDRVYVKAGEGENCIKFNLNNNSSKLFVPQNNKNYAIAYTEGANVMPICFTPKESGIYTLNFNMKHMNCSYLHLIDNATGADIDLLRTPSYTFDSKDCGYATRFKLVFEEEATNEIAESFTYISNGELMINNIGNATLQVMDLTGRILRTESIQDSYSMSLNLSAGVYVVSLCNGNDVKTQKIVVE